MFTRHVAKKLSAYLHGELSREDSQRVAEHLLGCERCRKEFDCIKLGAQLAEQLPMLTAPAELWSEIETMLNATPRRAARETKVQRPGFALNWSFIAAASAAIIITVAVVIVFIRQQPGPQRQPNQGSAWEVESLAGAIKVGSDRVRGKAQLEIGGTLETDNTSRARINVSRIGQVELEPNSRVRLVETKDTEHRIALDRGIMHARIWAPPRLFFVDTPSAEAIDLGCAYTLGVDDAGRGFLRVTDGWVALVRDGRESFVPLGALCEMRPGIGPGTPYFETASETLKAALSDFDFNGGSQTALQIVLRESSHRDTLTLWHLLQRTEGEQRVQVLDRMVALTGLPKGVTREGIMSLDPGMLKIWKDELESLWY